jgi:hypothetical protein
MFRFESDGWGKNIFEKKYTIKTGSSWQKLVNGQLKRVNGIT